jgi:hypothetical protein
MTHLPGCISENLVHAQVPLLVLDSSLSLVAGNSLADKILPQQAWLDTQIPACQSHGAEAG